ncbi:hypothetical protein J6590_107052, partial [Homalodisca vitripennis]
MSLFRNIPWKNVAIGGGIAAVIVGGGLWAYRRYNSSGGTPAPIVTPDSVVTVPEPVTDPREEQVEEPAEATSNAAMDLEATTEDGPENNTVPNPDPFTPIGDGEERQYSIVPVNVSQASMIPLVGNGSMLRLAAAANSYEDEE